MKLYYLTSEKWAKVILNERRVKLSTVGELNDPFELLGASVGDKRARKIFHYVQQRLSERYGMLCLSSTWKCPAMWAHYGDKHRGVCLGFDVPDAMPREVRYTPDRLIDLLGEKPELRNMSIAGIETLMTTKYSEWSYEREWRLIRPFREAIAGADGKHFLPFDDQLLVLREVIIGHRCSWMLRDAAAAVGHATKEVRLKKIRPSFQTFEMVRQLREPVIRVRP